jgi:hypothetical protein
MTNTCSHLPHFSLGILLLGNQRRGRKRERNDKKMGKKMKKEHIMKYAVIFGDNFPNSKIIFTL